MSVNSTRKRRHVCGDRRKCRRATCTTAYAAAWSTPARRGVASAIATALVSLAPAAWAHAAAEGPSDAEVDAGAGEGASPGKIVQRGATRPSLGAGEVRACSFRVPLCVHAGARVPKSQILATLASAERAWETATGVLDLPAPDTSLDTLAFDVYLKDGVDGLAEVPFESRDVRSRVDRASSFLLVDTRVASGCTLDALVARGIAEACLWRSAPATDIGSARSETEYLARLMVPCATLAADAAAAFQSHPERAIVDAWPENAQLPGELYARGASLFHDWLDVTYGAGPGAIVRAMWALSPTMSLVPGWKWQNEPDGFDVLRASFKGAMSTGSTVDDLLLDFAVARAFFGDADDNAHLPESRRLGAAARVRHEWDIDWPVKPRRLAPELGVAPTGSSYITVRRAGAAKGSRLRVEIAWEEHSKMRWALVRVAADGHEMGRVMIPARDRATEAQMTLVDLDEVDHVLIVGVNAGDAAYTFDPDDEVWEPHGFFITLASE